MLIDAWTSREQRYIEIQRMQVSVSLSQQLETSTQMIHCRRYRRVLWAESNSKVSTINNSQSNSAHGTHATIDVLLSSLHWPL